MDSLFYVSGMNFASIFFSSIISLVTFPILLLGLALVLYFFTGEKKESRSDTSKFNGLFG